MGKAGRNLEGVRKCILHAVWQAQGQGCAPGALGVCIGSDRAHGYELAKDQLFRTLDDVNPHPELAQLESEIMEEANRLGIGAMGFGGKVSLIGCKISAANRLPASFFVSVAYDCWAYRRLGVQARRRERRDHRVAVSRSLAARRKNDAGRRLPAHRPRNHSAPAPQRGADPRAQSGRRGADHGRVLHRPRRGARAPDEESAARRRRSARRAAVSLRSRDAQERRAVDRQGRRTHHQQPRGAVSGRHHQELRRARGDGQGRHGQEDSGGAARSTARSISTASAARRSITRAPSTRCWA